MGGARARSGPVPDPLALRRDRPSDEAGWTMLPAAGRRGAVPGWPLSAPLRQVVADGEPVLLEEVQRRELEIWAGEWARPQAVMWERNGQEIEVALYVRNLAEAELPNAVHAKRNLVKQHQEALGISIPGLLRNRWRIAEVAVSDLEVEETRERFRVVPGGS